ncbi:MAG: hypothetical protein AAB699_02515 [Patescibacteria group bacterium]
MRRQIEAMAQEFWDKEIATQFFAEVARAPLGAQSQSGIEAASRSGRPL